MKNAHAPITCPKCFEAMQAVHFGRATIDRCLRCRGIWFHGLWFKRDELDRAQQHAAPTPLRAATLTAIPRTNHP